MEQPSDTAMNDQQKKALEKIKKCLSLAKSSNPHEAEAAMRQARKLMDKFNLDTGDIEASMVEEFRLNIGKSSTIPEQWQRMLGLTIAEAFGCIVIYQYGRAGRHLVFVGERGQPELCSYAYDVLLRQLKESRRQYLANLAETQTAARRKKSMLYTEGWIRAVYKQVSEFSGVSEESEQAIVAYMKKNYATIKPGKMKRRKLTKEEYQAHLKGIEDGEGASLYRPMQMDQREALSHAQ